MAQVLSLLYHRICNIEHDIYNIAVSIEQFEKQIQYLSENYQIIRFEENWNEVQDNVITVTFDDGYADNYQNALPILEKYKVPATVFVSTGNIGTEKEFWYDELERLLTMGNICNEQFDLDDPVYKYSWETKTQEQRLELAVTLRWLLRKDPFLSRRESWFQQLMAWAQLAENGRPSNFSLNEQQLKQLSDSSYITIGGHTVTHRSLGVLGIEEQEREIKNSIKSLEKLIDKRVEVFSYPFGQRTDYTDNTIQILKESGIKKAATTENRCAGVGENIYKIPRKKVGKINIEEFQKFIKNSWES